MLKASCCGLSINNIRRPVLMRKYNARGGRNIKHQLVKMTRSRDVAIFQWLIHYCYRTMLQKITHKFVRTGKECTK